MSAILISFRSFSRSNNINIANFSRVRCDSGEHGAMAASDDRYARVLQSVLDLCRIRRRR